MRLERLIGQHLRDINFLLKSLKANRSRKENAKLFLESSRTGAAPEWWPSLRALQTAQHRAGMSPQREIFREVLRQWIELGTHLDFSEGKERKRHEREAKHRCSWYGCMYHRVAPDASLMLKKCAGCGENHYCSRECQKRYVRPPALCSLA